ncbi:hypothetical protein LCGC14_2122770 [marine sediment metagenome]|uniref:Uncharacterized protein n=1 Tax=marine sediment metagenome TaxID=412755 RepID=A0A0F9GGT7_9ZZZZ
MSDSKKPKVSEIRAHYEGMVAKDTAAFYLLDLVKRLGEALEEYGDHALNCDIGPGPCTCGWEETRALLEEIKL